ncbi:MAG: 3'-5' exonuclease domain-containing protein 2 [Bacteroidales bacterium]|nr:3'-5' exonuclease domain-containing protein 2 [Bacteroidales bacterium]
MNDRFKGEKFISLHDYTVLKYAMTKFENTITKEEILDLPLTTFDKEIYVIEDEDQIDEAIEYLRIQSILGFDTETKPAFKKGQKNSVALLQLSTSEKAFLFRLNKIRFNGQIRKILSDNTIVKVGVAIRDDLNALKRKSTFTPQSFIELQDMVKKYGIQNFSLQKLSAIVLGLRISKSKRLSNWEAETLNEAQQKYAATDAWISLEVYKKLLNSKAMLLPQD